MGCDGGVGDRPYRMVEDLDALSPEEAEVSLARLCFEVQLIQTQLGSGERRGELGRLMDPREYAAWRKRATYALTHKTNLYRHLKRRVRRDRAEAPLRSGVSSLSDLEVVEAAYGFVMRNVDRLLPINPEDQRVIDQMRAAIGRSKRSEASPGA